MYNINLKKRFLSTYGLRQDISLQTIGLAHRALEFLAKYETIWCCDLYEQSDLSKLSSLVDNLIHKRVHNGYSLLLTLREYVEWCYQKKIKNATLIFLTVIPDEVTDLKIDTVSGPQQLQNYLSSIYRQESDNTIDNIYRTFFWLAFSGLEERDAYKITSDNVDLVNRTIKYSGHLYPIYNEALNTIPICAQNDTFEYFNDNYTTKSITRRRAPGKILIRGIKSTATFENKQMRVKVSQKTKYAIEHHQTAMSLSYFKVWQSGIFYREFLREKQNGAGPQSFEDVAEIMLLSGIRSYKTGASATMEQKRSRILRELNTQYIKWKIAHEYA